MFGGRRGGPQRKGGKGWPQVLEGERVAWCGAVSLLDVWFFLIVRRTCSSPSGGFVAETVDSGSVVRELARRWWLCRVAGWMLLLLIGCVVLSVLYCCNIVRY